MSYFFLYSIIFLISSSVNDFGSISFGILKFFFFPETLICKYGPNGPFKTTAFTFLLPYLILYSAMLFFSNASIASSRLILLDDTDAVAFPELTKNPLGPFFSTTGFFLYVPKYLISFTTANAFLNVIVSIVSPADKF